MGSSWHVTALATDLLLGTSNLVFWEMFVAAEGLAVVYGSTTLHWIFVVLQFIAAFAATDEASIFRLEAGAPGESSRTGRGFYDHDSSGKESIGRSSAV